jgi:hypothetical protein
VHSINASTFVFEDKVEACLKCPNLDEEVRSRILCKNPYGNTHITNGSSHSHWALQCNYSDYVANEEKPTKFGKIISEKRYNFLGCKTYEKFLTEVCDECYLNPKNYEKN